MEPIESYERELQSAEEDSPRRDAKSRIETAFKILSDEVRELSLGITGEVERVKGALSPVEFLRNYVLPGRPCIITDALDHWEALQKWSNDYLCSVLKDQIVSVHFTPDGRADALVDPLHMFANYNCPVVERTPSASSTTAHALCPPSSETQNSSTQLKKNHNGNGESQIVRPHVITPPVSHCTSHSSETLNLCTIVKETHHENEEYEIVAASPSTTPFSETLISSGNEECDHVGGYLDSPGSLFVRAYVEKLPFPDALEQILGRSGGVGRETIGVAYAQEQNGCFLSEYGALAGDAEVHIPWATEALGCMPEAVNLWIGNEHAVTSFHKDHYENLYAVVTGAKHFTLVPPVDVHRMYIKAYPSAQYVRMKENFGIVLDELPSMVPWVSVDPYPADGQATEIRFPKYLSGSRPFTCSVQAGEILYLPSMWFHHVRQSPDPEGRTIAVNFWYDMQFDIKYAYFNMLQALLCLQPPSK